MGPKRKNEQCSFFAGEGLLMWSIKVVPVRRRLSALANQQHHVTGLLMAQERKTGAAAKRSRSQSAEAIESLSSLS